MAEQNTTADPYMDVQVRLPKPLQDKILREYVWLGLFYISIGKKPASIPDEKGKWANTRVRLSPEAKKHYDVIVGYPEFSSKNKIIVSALAWLYENPLLVQRLSSKRSSIENI